ncbi:TRAP transporter small permease [Sedimentitalea todarodis]|uniref:TRAP transporter small permease protein n=1 Tax=Sedimentitalea todarodis TaxID=1631240 RepID=A0ABU3VEK0_9RHOB|nr:TRAP transporter small permease [Sedimentitalea todarodis]MDU9004513.1 TRAP transporter small permease [Sedimentitalea todarodis]
MAISLFDRLCLVFAWLSGLLAFFVMSVTFIGVVMRYGLRQPLMGGFEMIEIGMGLIVFTAVPLMIRRRGNISVTILAERFPPMLSRVTSLVSDLLGAALMGFIAWRVWLQGERLLTYNEVTMELRVPKGLIAQGMAVLLAVAALAFLVCAIEALRRNPSPLPDKPDSI